MSDTTVEHGYGAKTSTVPRMDLIPYTALRYLVDAAAILWSNAAEKPADKARS